MVGHIFYNTVLQDIMFQAVYMILYPMKRLISGHYVIISVTFQILPYL